MLEEKIKALIKDLKARNYGDGYGGQLEAAVDEAKDDMCAEIADDLERILRVVSRED